MRGRLMGLVVLVALAAAAAGVGVGVSPPQASAATRSGCPSGTSSVSTRDGWAGCLVRPHAHVVRDVGAPSALDVSEVPVSTAVSGRGAARSATEATAVGTPGIACHGDGVSGRRVQPVYVSFTDVGSRWAQAQGVLEANAVAATADVNQSALRNASGALTGSRREIRWVTDSSCRLQILNVALPKTSVQWGSTENVMGQIQMLRDAGLTNPARAYMVFADSTRGGGYALSGGPATSGASAYAFNMSQGSSAQGGVALAEQWIPWDPTSRVGALHELLHTMGAVGYGSALANGGPPNRSGNGHCNDGFDLMCYPDGGPTSRYTTGACPLALSARMLDCGENDYFSTTPAGWLASNPSANLASRPEIGGSAAGGPAGDMTHYAAPAPTSGTWTMSLTTFGASTQIYEPGPVAGYTPQRSVWVSWRAPSTRSAKVRTYSTTASPEFDTILGVYEFANGLPDPVLPTQFQGRLIGSNDNQFVSGTTGASQVTFNAVAGRTYIFEVASKTLTAQGATPLVVL